MAETKDMQDPNTDWDESAAPEAVDTDTDVDVDVDDIEVEAVDDLEVEAASDDATDDTSDDDEDDDSSAGAALDELEAEELEMLTDDEAAETIIVDEAAEMRAIRRAEIALDVDPEVASSDEFVCQSCFLVKRTSQLADKRKKICTDCAS